MKAKLLDSTSIALVALVLYILYKTYGIRYVLAFICLFIGAWYLSGFYQSLFRRPLYSTPLMSEFENYSLATSVIINKDEALKNPIKKQIKRKPKKSTKSKPTKIK